jgi:ribosomal protein S18 acetylase RimI-like enzyme
MPTCTINIAVLDDIEDIYNCNKSVLPIHYNKNYYRNLIKKPYSCIITTKLNNTLIGYLMGETINKNFHITSIGVYPLYRKRGIGREMIKYVINMVSNICDNITLNVYVENNSAILFYKSIGFVIDKTLVNYYGNTFKGKSGDGFRMIKSISNI